jgi:pimeloyl-ACP methyl ester carboxylesterase
VAKLALLDTGARGDTPEQTERRKIVIALAKSGRYAEVPDIAFPVYVHRSRHGDAALKQIVRTMAEETGSEAFLRQQQAIIGRPDSHPGLPAIACPTIVIVGEGDEATPPELSREIAAGIPGSRLVMIPDSGHLSTLEQPQAVTKALAEWMRS